MRKIPLYFFLALLLVGCESNQSIVSNIDEKQANEIIVYLASKRIVAHKMEAPVAEGAGSTAHLYNIMVEPDRAVDAMALLNKVGLPKRMGTNLLTLFAKSGLMSSDKEEAIRYQAGLAEELQNTILKIDGILEADVQLSFPSEETGPTPAATTQKVTAAVYIKHQGVLDDPNNHLESKIKRLLAGSVNDLTYDNVTVISDRSTLADIMLSPQGEPIGGAALEQAYVGIWGLVLTKSSLVRFRVIFFFFILLIALLCAGLGWAIYKFYPQIRKELFSKKDELAHSPSSSENFPEGSSENPSEPPQNHDK